VASGLDDYFEHAVRAGADPKTAKNWLLGAVRARMNDEGVETATALRDRVAPERLAALIALVERGTISGSIAKDVFDKMFASGRTAEEIVSAEGLTQIDDESDLAGLIAGVLAQHADAVSMYQGGKTTAFGFLVGQVMKAAGGKANPRRVNELLRKTLGAGSAR
jgi:aspartyl-tRNA(Asn)/glutamyl-tRNA(Gln) amidotransferase subunit B